MMRLSPVLTLLLHAKQSFHVVNPFETGVVTIGSFDGKGQFNVIKDKIELEGDVRALTDATRDKIRRRITTNSQRS